MRLEELKKSVSSLGNEDVNFFVEQIENLNNKTDIEIVFSGTISNGKSTLINGLIGKDLLPMELGATTSLITTIQTGKNKIVALFNDGSTKNYELSKSSIQEISKENYVENIQIFMEDFLYQGIKFVDTPGINDISQTREGRTFNYVPFADAVIFIVDASKGLTKEEQSFFDSKIVKANKDKIFIVLNKIDTIDEEDIELEKLLSSNIVNEYSIYQISALKYLVGMIKNDSERIEKSGVLNFKNDLNKYLFGLNKNQIFKKRMKKSLENILNLATVQIETLTENISKDKPDIESSLTDVTIKIEDAKKIQINLENEIDNSIVELTECIHYNLATLKLDINTTIKNVQNTEFMIDKFNEEVPELCFKMIENVKQCSDKKLKGLNIEVKELDELYLWVIRNVDDVLTQMVWLLTFVPKVGKIVTPFIPKIQEGIRNIVDMFGGKIIQSAVESKVNELLNSIEENINQSISEYKSDMLEDYERNQMGTIRSELLSLENILKLNEYKKDEIEHQVEYFQNNLNILHNNINSLLDENSKN